jgi:nonsense-mediated mRNA decay protein 3
VIHLIDPLSGQQASMTNDGYWRDPLRPVVTAARSKMIRFVVLAKEPIVLRRNVSKRQTNRKQRNRLASLTLAREADLGINDTQYEEQSNVGYLMKSGDVCVGYDLTETQFVDDMAEDFRSEGKLPDVIVLRKLYGGVASGEANAAKMRIWRLQRLDVEVAEDLKSSKAAKKDAELDDMDEEDFLQEVEADKEMRTQMNLYKSEQIKKAIDDAMETGGATKADDDDDDDDQEIRLGELLDGLVLDAGPDKEEFVKSTFEEYLEGGKAAKDGINYVGREESRQVRDKESAVPLTEFAKEYKPEDFKFI